MAEEICRKGITAAELYNTNILDIYFQLIDIVLKQPGRAKECENLISDIEEKYSYLLPNRKYYDIIGKTLAFILGRDKEDISGSYTDFILLRLLNEPLNYSKEPLELCMLFNINRLARYPDTLKHLKAHIQILIRKMHVDNPMAVLISDDSTDDDRVDAYLKIFRTNCYHSVQLCLLHQKNVLALEKACDEIIKSCEWTALNSHIMFDFARSLIFTDQDKGDTFISMVYNLYKDRNLAVGDPIGLLCHRHRRRKELLQSIHITPNINKKKLNVAVCIGGQLRGYKGNLECLLNTLGLESHNYRVFVHTWNNVGRKFPIAVHAERTFSIKFSKAYYECFVHKPNLQGYIKKQYPNLYLLLVSSSIATQNILSDEYKTSDIVIDNEEDEPFSSWDNLEKMHYKIYAVHQLAVKSGEQFDLMIRIRPDLRRKSDEPLDLIHIYNKSKSNLSIFTGGGITTGYGMKDYKIDDNFAIGAPEAMAIYANTFKDFFWHKENSTYSRTNKFTGHTTLEHNLFCNGVHIDKIHHKMFGGFQDPEKLSAKDVFDALCKDLDSREQIMGDRKLLEACKEDIKSLEQIKS